MKQSQLSASKRFAKPVLFGSLVLALATAFFNRHLFFQDVQEIRAQERLQNEARRVEFLEVKQRAMEEAAERKRAKSSSES